MGTAVKSAAIVVGAGFGLLEALSALGRAVGQNNPQTIENKLRTLEDRLEEMVGRRTGSVTQEELSRSAEETLRKVEALVETRFEYQSRSIEALRVMIGQTDELLQRVLDGLESSGNGAEVADEAPLTL